ncbi:unnamed protein product [Microthlaspi erraticum]|uniref:Uncharacterized protein n=1 Tax=Microthlaspi erraticum TaxID=1685480 RepID=A0A6D2I252_9BRAS|nr:unnamed protein product [Microthlaspi erraticum]
MVSRSAAEVGRVMDWPMLSQPDAGCGFPAQMAPSAVVREIGRAAARRCFPARAAWSAPHGIEWWWLGRPRDIFPGRDAYSAGWIELWPRLQTDGFGFDRPRFLDRAAGPVFTLLVITPFLLIQMRPFQLRWKVNSLRARRELVLMKSIE